MEKVKKLVELGVSIPNAIKQALGIPVGEFAVRYDIPQTTASEVINGARRPSEKHLSAFISELGGTEEDWRDLLWRAGKPESPSVA